jgi:metal-responsive CopG/Arc/MetJ family transcriptional regulator
VVYLEIISVSIDPETLKELNKIQANLGFKSRSKMIRATIDSLMNEFQVIDSLKGKHEVVLIVTYREHERDHVSAILHKFEDSIKTTIHQHRSTLCLDIINVNADATRIRELFSVLKRNKCVKSMNFTLLGSSS